MSDEKDISIQLYFACAKRGDIDGLEETKIDITQVDDLGNTALHWAASGNHPECVQHLVEKRKGNVNLKNQNGDTRTYTLS
jgi:ankyrin repeat protein